MVLVGGQRIPINVEIVSFVKTLHSGCILSASRKKKHINLRKVSGITVLL